MYRSFEHSGKKVSLGGRSRNAETRDQLKSRLRREKEKRMHLALEVKSAQIIQVAWRVWICRKATRNLLREQWISEYGSSGENLKEKHLLSSFTCVARIVYFVESGVPGDIACLGSTCEAVLNLLCTLDGKDLLSRSVCEDRGQPIFKQQPLQYIISLLLKCLEITQNKAQDWAHILLLSKDDFCVVDSDCHKILNFMLKLFRVSEWNSSNLGFLLNRLARSLYRKKVFLLLSLIVREICSVTGVTTIHNTVLEHLLITNVELADFVLSEGDLNADLGTFQLWSIPCLRKFSPALAQKSHSLLLHTLPFFQSLANSHKDISSQGSKFEELRKGSCYAFSNLLELGSYQFPSTLEGARLCSGIVHFMDWVIAQNRDSYFNFLSAMEPSTSSLIPDQEFQYCAQILMRSTGQRFLVSLAESLLPEARLAHPDLNDFLKDSDASFFKVLDFTFSICEEDELLESVRTFSASGKMVRVLWYGYIKEVWKQKINSLTLIPSLDVLESMIPPLLILTEIYSSFLLVAGKTEILTEEIPLPLKEIYDPEEPSLGLISVLKNCFWSYVWKSMPSRYQHTKHQKNFWTIAKRCGKLLCQLYDLCLHWDLIPVEHFHMQSSQITCFVSQATSVNNSDKMEGDSSDLVMKPVWSVLTHAPCIIPFYDRVKIFQSQLRNYQSNRSSSSSHIHAVPLLKIRRAYFLEDAFNTLGKLNGIELHSRIRIEFVDEHGIQEAGVDGGGLFKEFLEELCKYSFSPDYGYFASTDQQEVYPNPSAPHLQPNALQMLVFLGKVVGKAVYDGILLELPFAYFFLKKFRNQLCDLHDLASLDQVVYANLIALKSSKEHVHNLGLTFTITEHVYGKYNQEVELKPDGKRIPVNAQNVLEYIHRFADYRVNRQCKTSISAFLQGFFEVLEADWLKMFSASEIQLLISGALYEVDVENLKKSVVYAGGYHENHPVIIHFWDVIESSTVEEQRQFLRFVTGCSRAPLLGFEQLHPKICIRMTGNGDNPDTNRLPTSATCANLLKLPAYPSKAVLKEKLFYAISAKCGFGLS